MCGRCAASVTASASTERIENHHWWLQASTRWVSRSCETSRPRLTAATRAEIAAEYAEGKSSLALAKKYGIANATVLGILRDHRVVVSKQKSLTSEQVTQAAILYEEGQPLERIAGPLGVSASSVRNALLAAGHQTRPRLGRD